MSWLSFCREFFCREVRRRTDYATDYATNSYATHFDVNDDRDDADGYNTGDRGGASHRW
ncbi:MAG: hypothetical protein AAF685_06765 [Cyanobacteria bacterium P01_C01_bin.89]